MAYTKIHAIKATVHKAIAYICNPEKTDEGILISSYGCSPQTAHFDFKFALSKTNAGDENKAYHMIQSFLPGEVDFDTAHQIGIELADKVLEAKLYIRGRDVDNDAFVIEMQECRWKKVGTLEEMQEREALREYQNNPIVRVINKALEGPGQWRGRMTELIEFAEQNGIHINFTPQQLSKEISNLEYQLKMIDNIEHGIVCNGKGSSPHIFKKYK